MKNIHPQWSTLAQYRVTPRPAVSIFLSKKKTIAIKKITEVKNNSFFNAPLLETDCWPLRRKRAASAASTHVAAASQRVTCQTERLYREIN
jgi:hypothetical protein